MFMQKIFHELQKPNDNAVDKVTCHISLAKTAMFFVWSKEKHYTLMDLPVHGE